MHTWVAFLFSSLASSVNGVAVVHEKREGVLQDATDRQPIEGEAVLPMRIGLRSNKRAMANAEAWLMVRGRLVLQPSDLTTYLV